MTVMSKEYAGALFAIAREEASVREYSEALDEISALFEENSEYMELLVCPAIPLSERKQALKEAFSGRVPEYILYFLLLLWEKGRLRLFGECVKEYRRLAEASENAAAAKVTSAVELTQSEKDRIVRRLEKLSGKSVVIEYITDPEIMGGVIIETEGRVIDGSLRRHLQQAKEVIGK